MIRSFKPLALAIAFSLLPLGAALAADTPDVAKARQELRAAQDELRDLTRRIAELSMRLGKEQGGQGYAFRYLADPKRAMIGVVLRADAAGVKIGAVTPGGPAEKAGLRSGDLIVAINGKPVAAKAALDKAVHGDDGSEDVVDAAREQIGDLNAGDKVKLRYMRDGKTQDIEIAAERRESWSWPMMAGSLEGLPGLEGLRGLEGLKALEGLKSLEALKGLPAMPDEEREIEVIVENAQRAAADGKQTAAQAHVAAAQAMRDAQRAMQGDMRRRVMVFAGGAWSQLKLAAVNPELGRYFGTDQGVLILDKSSDSFAELKAGDVIVGIGGDKVDDAPDAMRHFSERKSGALVNVDIVRDRKRQTVAVTVPEQPDFVLPAPPAPPAPPTPPAPPAPAAKAIPPAPPAPPSAPTPPTPPTPPGHGGLRLTVV